MRVSCIIPCVDYDDFLNLTLPYTKPHFDDIIVLTSDADVLTKKCCRKHGVVCVSTNEWYHDGAKFNKGRALNVGLGLLNNPEWICSLDADIAIAGDFRAHVDDLDKHCLYTVRRRFVRARSGFRKFQDTGDYSHFKSDENALRRSVDKLKSWGAEDSHLKNLAGLWGYLQLWNHHIYNVVFPDKFRTASTYDLMFSYRWPPSRRRWIPKVVALHLGTIQTNWGGRRTEKWSG